VYVELVVESEEVFTKKLVELNMSFYFLLMLSVFG